MSNINRIEEAIERAKQAERRRVRDENRESDRQRKIATRRQIIVGEMVVKHFPDIINLLPGLNRKDTDAEFAGLEDFISAIANDTKSTALFQSLVSEKLSTESSHK